MWDRDVDGYGRGEGVAAVIMKSLSAALADKDPIQCVIRATGLNSDGEYARGTFLFFPIFQYTKSPLFLWTHQMLPTISALSTFNKPTPSKAIELTDWRLRVIGKTPGVTMPNPIAQANLIRDTYTRAGLNIDKPEHRPQFFHAHGTGSKKPLDSMKLCKLTTTLLIRIDVAPAGDPREAEAIARAFYSKGAEDKLYVGSVKTIFGHTEGTAGLASLIGTMLALKHGIIPPNMHFNNLNPQVAPFYNHLEVPTKAKHWPKLPPGQPRRASVNSFGRSLSNLLHFFWRVRSLIRARFRWQ